MIDDQYCGLGVVLDGTEHEGTAVRWAANWAERSHHHLTMIEPSELGTRPVAPSRQRVRLLTDELRFSHPGLTIRYRKLSGAPDAVITAAASHCTAMAVPRPSNNRRNHRPVVPRCPLVVIADEAPQTLTVSLLIDSNQENYAPAAFAFAYAASSDSDLQAVLVGSDPKSTSGAKALEALAVCYASVALHTVMLPSWDEIAKHVTDSRLVVVGNWIDGRGLHRADEGAFLSAALAEVGSPVALIAHD